MDVNPMLLDALQWPIKNQLMVEKAKGFAKRFEELRAGMSFQALSDAVYRKTGIRVSPQGMHKWAKGGGADPDKIELMAKYWGVSAAWLAYGVGDPNKTPTLSDAVDALPDDSRREVLDYIQYKITRAEAMMAQEDRSNYVALIEKLRKSPGPQRPGSRKKSTKSSPKG